VTSEIDLRARRMAISNAIGHAKFFSRSHDAVIRVYDEAGNVIKTLERAGAFREF
jgi:predicted HTH transcriptional regulator